MNERSAAPSQHTPRDVLDQFTKAEINDASAWMRAHPDRCVAVLRDDAAVYNIVGMPAPLVAVIGAMCDAFNVMTAEEMRAWSDSDHEQRLELETAALNRNRS